MSAKPQQALNWRKIQQMKDEIARYEQDLAGFNSRLEQTNEVLKYDPDNENAQKQKAQWEDAIREFTIEIEGLKAKLPVEDTAPKAEKVAPKPQVQITVGESVLAHKSGESRMTAARVLAITGGANNLVYQVKWKDGETAQVRAADCKPATKINETVAKKRKAEEESGVQHIKNGTVISAAPQLNKEPSMATDGPDRPAKIPRKLGSTKKLEKARGNWQSFQSKQKQKDSMFRTGEGVAARVGVVGSGKAMTADVKRKRHVHAEIEED